MNMRSFALFSLLMIASPLYHHTLQAKDITYKSGTVTEIQSVDELDALIQSGVSLVVDCYAPWCGPCKQMMVPFKQVAEEFTHIVFVKVNIDTLEEVMERYNIRSIPTLLAFKDGKKIGQSSGSKSFKDLKNYVNSLFHG